VARVTDVSIPYRREHGDPHVFPLEVAQILEPAIDGVRRVRSWVIGSQQEHRPSRGVVAL
jgi:hypothetical protein